MKKLRRPSVISNTLLKAQPAFQHQPYFFTKSKESRHETKKLQLSSVAITLTNLWTEF